MTFNFSELLQFTNLLLIPLVIYVVKIERALAKFEAFMGATEKEIERQAKELRAAHRRMDRVDVPAASRE